MAVAGEVARRGRGRLCDGRASRRRWASRLRIDALGAAMGLLICTVGVLGALYSGHALVVRDRQPEKHTLFQAGYLLCACGLSRAGVHGRCVQRVRVPRSVVDRHVCAWSAAGEARDRRALPAAFNYLIFGTVGATFYVIGIGFLYGATGTLNMADMAARLATLGDSSAVQAGLCVHRGRAWHQGGDVPAAWLAAGRVFDSAEPCLGLPRGDGDQGGDLPDGALRVRRVSADDDVWRAVHALECWRRWRRRP